MDREVFIFGAGGLAKEVTLMLNEMNAATQDRTHIAGYVVTSPQASAFMGKPVIAEETFLQMLATREDTSVVLAVGAPSIRRRFFDRFSGYRVTYPTLVHPSARLNPSVRLDEGVVICASVMMTVDIEIGRHSYINFSCTIAHDVRIGEFVQVNPCTCISGGVAIGDNCLIGAGSTIHPGVRIGPGSTVGLGSVVFSDVDENTTVLGNPARRLSSRHVAREEARGTPR